VSDQADDRIVKRWFIGTMSFCAVVLAGFFGWWYWPESSVSAKEDRPTINPAVTMPTTLPTIEQPKSTKGGKEFARNALASFGLRYVKSHPELGLYEGTAVDPDSIAEAKLTIELNGDALVRYRYRRYGQITNGWDSYFSLASVDPRLSSKITSVLAGKEDVEETGSLNGWDYTVERRREGKRDSVLSITVD
jgi:hypothetical protein